MAKSQQSFNKSEQEKKRLKKRKDKERKKEDRKANSSDGSFESMLAYVDEFGNITSVPQDLSTRKKVSLDVIEIGVPKRAEIDPADLIKKGIVTFFNSAKGFGFIQDKSSKESIFTHINGHTEPINENDHVTYEVERGQKGLVAVNVKKDK